MVSEKTAEALIRTEGPNGPAYFFNPSSDKEWLSTPPPSLTAGECHVWLLRLNEPVSLVLEPLLCQAEKERAENFKLPRPHTQFIATRGGLRLLLSHYLGISASQLIFSQTAHGKPVLTAPFPNIHFNVSHSGHQALIAITQSTPIGVDIEVHQDLKDLAGLLGMIAHPRELSAWQALSCAEKASEFYRLWTLKEALSKALGRGLSLDFRKLEIGMDCGGPPKLIKLDDPADDQGTWQIQPLEHEPGYSAALATAPGVSLRRFELKILNN